MLQVAFGRRGCAGQSTISETLNACTPDNVQQLRTALKQILHQQGRYTHHDYDHTWQLLDVDMTGLVAGRQAEGATKGYFANQPHRRGRQLGRVLATASEEIVVERLYEGKRQLDAAFQDLVRVAEGVLELLEKFRESAV